MKYLKSIDIHTYEITLKQLLIIDNYPLQVDKLYKKNEQHRRELMQAEEDLKRTKLAMNSCQNKLEERLYQCDPSKREIQRTRGA